MICGAEKNSPFAEFIPFWLFFSATEAKKEAENRDSIQKRPETTLPTELFEAKDAKSFVENYCQFVSANELKRRQDVIIEYEIFYIPTRFYYRDRITETDCQELIEQIKSIGKNDLTRTTRYQRDYSQRFPWAPKKEISVYEFCTLLKNSNVKSEDNHHIQSILEAMDAQPDEVPFNNNEERFSLKKVMSDVLNGDGVTQGGLVHRFIGIRKAFDLCISCLEYQKWIFPITKDQVVKIMKQLMFDMGENNFKDYVLLRSSYLEDYPMSNLNQLIHHGFATKCYLIARSADCLKYVCAAMEIEKFDTYLLKMNAIRYLLSMIYAEKDESKKNLLSLRVAELMPCAQAQDLITDFEFRCNGHAVLFQSILNYYHSDLALKSMLAVLTRSDVCLEAVQFSIYYVDSQSIKLRNPLEHLCVSTEAKAYVWQEFEATAKILIAAGYDPSAEIAAGKIPEKYAVFIKTVFLEYLKELRTTVAKLINNDPAGIVVSYFFQQPALAVPASIATIEPPSKTA